MRKQITNINHIFHCLFVNSKTDNIKTLRVEVEKFLRLFRKIKSSLLANTYQAKVNDKVSTTIGDNIITNFKD